MLWFHQINFPIMKKKKNANSLNPDSEISEIAINAEIASLEKKLKSLRAKKSEIKLLILVKPF